MNLTSRFDSIFLFFDDDFHMGEYSPGFIKVKKKKFISDVSNEMKIKRMNKYSYIINN